MCSLTPLSGAIGHIQPIANRYFKAAKFCCCENPLVKLCFCQWHILIGQHFCQAFSQKDKIFRVSQLSSHLCFSYQTVAQLACKVSQQVLFLMEVEDSIDISGLPERNVYGSMRGNGVMEQNIHMASL